ncbi:hypothetical protein F2Q70_00003661 [Brassica cretica]|uniref:Uncharacterized protein n=1 Tax=Brassica cretica TaxID=69181 RepID=A0A8S9IVB1_BRACR|nr:hypothetical protein F2Q70_00003661 [Brassica cretica]
MEGSGVLSESWPAATAEAISSCGGGRRPGTAAPANGGQRRGQVAGIGGAYGGLRRRVRFTRAKRRNFGRL